MCTSDHNKVIREERKFSWKSTLQMFIAHVSYLSLNCPQHVTNKVNRCLARYSPRATTTNQPTNKAPNEPAMERNAKFGPNLVVSGQKILFFTGEIKSFVTHITENPPRHLVRIVFWSGIGQNVQKMAIFGPK